MTDLITRLREAKEGSRVLDAAILHAVDAGLRDDLIALVSSRSDAQKSDVDLNAPRYTTDLSAAVALCERVLPGWVIRLDIFTEDGITNACVGALWRGDVKHKTPALALCLAMLTAKDKAP